LVVSVRIGIAKKERNFKKRAAGSCGQLFWNQLRCADPGQPMALATDFLCLAGIAHSPEGLRPAADKYIAYIATDAAACIKKRRTKIIYRRLALPWLR
jgi:hypothetical protein